MTEKVKESLPDRIAGWIGSMVAWIVMYVIIFLVMHYYALWMDREILFTFRFGNPT